MFNLNFNDDKQMEINIPEQDESISLEISDELNAFDEDLSDEYKDKIIEFINNSIIWFKEISNKIKDDLGDNKFRLMTIYILSEQDADSIIFGLLFNVDVDKEHGRGAKIDGNSLKIIEYGLADVAIA